MKGQSTESGLRKRSKLASVAGKAKKAANPIIKAVKGVLQLGNKPFAVILAGHNGSGKSTFWYEQVADELRIPLMNADRLMLSILPEPGSDGHLRDWAQQLRDTNVAWMEVGQQGVQGFVGAAIAKKVPFAFETVFSHWKVNPDGTIESKIDLIKDLQRAGYFVLLTFVGLTSADLSIGRVLTRVAKGGHAVSESKLRTRFPKTQLAIRHAIELADAAILVDNSRTEKYAFTPVHIRRKKTIEYDIRDATARPSRQITTWLDIVVPHS